jgi:hypothetical protein
MAETRIHLVLVVMFISCVTEVLSGQILVQQEYRGEKVECAYSGLRGVAKPCGTYGHTRVFTGTVRSAVDVVDYFDRRLEITPDEVFLGDTSEATAVASQACLGSQINIGDKWLFYLDTDRDRKTLVLWHGGPSKPLLEAQDKLSMLRDMANLKDSGLLVGTVERIKNPPKRERLVLNKEKMVVTKAATTALLKNHQVIAKNVETGATQVTKTNDNGYFQFDLPAGTYEISVAPKYHLRELGMSESIGIIPKSIPGSIRIENGSCWEHSFTVMKAGETLHAD